MKQASFLINTKDDIIKKDEDLKPTNDKITCNLLSDDIKKNITSKKPSKMVENIYYFR